MTSTEEANFSEIESIEIKRRNDEVNALINATVRQFIRRNDSRTSLKSFESNWLSNRRPYWWSFIFFAGLGLDWYLQKSSTGFEFNYGSLICVVTLMLFYANKFDIHRINQEISKVIEKLYDLEMKWSAVTGADSFWELERFIKDNYFDNQNKKFREWRVDQRYHIIRSVCDFNRSDIFIEREEKLRNSRSENF